VYTESNNAATYTLTNSVGCDSIVSLNLTINTNTGLDVQSACSSYEWIDGIVYTESNNTATHTLTNSIGCDSIVSLNLTVNKPSSGVDVQSACGSYEWIDGIVYTESNNTATHALINSVGCDSIVSLNLTMNKPSSGIDEQIACGSYEWIDGVTYIESNNMASHTLTNSAGCDSIVSLNLTINKPSSGIDVQSACGSYEWIDGVTYTESNNTATHTLVNSAGCDSIVSLNLTINKPSTGLDIQSACGSYQWIDGNVYTESNNTATHTLTNSAGCDSIVSLNLMLNKLSTGVDVQSACSSYKWIDGNVYTESNNAATYTLTNSVGCDSIVSLNLTINTNTGVDVQSACGSYEWIDGIVYTESNNTATHTLTNSIGCDSIVSLNLTVNKPSSGVDVQSACGSYEWIDGIVYTESNNTATHTLTNSIGCDSIVSLNLIVIRIDISLSLDGKIIRSNQEDAQYQWFKVVSVDEMIVGAIGQSYTVIANGTYVVEITKGDCSEFSDELIINDFSEKPVQLQVNSQMYPNPCQGAVTLNLKKTYKELKVVITDENGKTLLVQYESNAREVQLFIEGAQGLYFIQLFSGSEKAVHKIIKY
jgi:hypothetical protein